MEKRREKQPGTTPQEKKWSSFLIPHQSSCFNFRYIAQIHHDTSTITGIDILQSISLFAFCFPFTLLTHNTLHRHYRHLVWFLILSQNCNIYKIINLQCLEWWRNTTTAGGFACKKSHLIKSINQQNWNFQIRWHKVFKSSCLLLTASDKGNQKDDEKWRNKYEEKLVPNENDKQPILRDTVRATWP